MAQLLSTAAAGKRLGGIKASAVLQLVRQKKLTAKKMIVRGKDEKPRLYISDTEIDRFIRDLPDVREEPIKPRSRRQSSVQKELEGATNYY